VNKNQQNTPLSADRDSTVRSKKPQAPRAKDDKLAKALRENLLRRKAPASPDKGE
jgi:hypothetical protein